MKSKYIIVERDGQEGVIVFSPFLLHKDVAGEHIIKAAGFCELKDNGNWVVSGGSDSLESYSRSQDVELFNKYLFSCNSVFTAIR
jgi:hypothetical protein